MFFGDAQKSIEAEGILANVGVDVESYSGARGGQFGKVGTVMATS